MLLQEGLSQVLVVHHGAAVGYLKSALITLDINTLLEYGNSTSAAKHCSAFT